MEASYPPPLNQLPLLGRPDVEDWMDYRELGIGEEHVPALLEMLGDERFIPPDSSQTADEPPYYTHVHVWRALGQLARPETVEPLIRRLEREPDDDWVGEEIPMVLGMIGPAALDPVRDALAGASGLPEPWLAEELSASLKEVGRRHPDVRDDAIAALAHQLEAFRDQAVDLNSVIVSNLLDLHAAEAAPTIEAAFVAGAVDEWVTGDWEDVQVELGLIEKRTSPRPRNTGFVPFPALRPRPDGIVRVIPPAPPRPAMPPKPVHPAAKAAQLRKAQKEAKRKRRK